MDARLDRLSGEGRSVLEAGSVIGLVFYREAVRSSSRGGSAVDCGSVARAPDGEAVRTGRSGDLHGRRGLPVRPRADSRRRVSLAPETRACRPARTVRALAGVGSGAADCRARGDHRLSPRAGVRSTSAELGSLDEHGRKLGVRAARSGWPPPAIGPSSAATCQAAANLLRPAPRACRAGGRSKRGLRLLLDLAEAADLDLGEFGAGAFVPDDAARQLREELDDRTLLSPRSTLVQLFIAEVRHGRRRRRRAVVPKAERGDGGARVSRRAARGPREGPGGCMAQIQRDGLQLRQTRRMPSARRCTQARLAGDVGAGDFRNICRRTLRRCSAWPDPGARRRSTQCARSSHRCGMATGGHTRVRARPSSAPPAEPSAASSLKRERCYCPLRALLRGSRQHGDGGTGCHSTRARAELLAGDLRAAERELRSLPTTSSNESVRALLPLHRRWSARYALLQQGRIDAAIAATEAAEQMAAADDVESHSLWRRVRAAAVTALGAPDEALPLALTAYDLVADTDAPLMKAFALLDLGELHAATGSLEEGRSAWQGALDLFEAKEASIPAAMARELLELHAVASQRVPRRLRQHVRRHRLRSHPVRPTEPIGL